MNVYEIITNKIIEKLEAGFIPWHKPWSGSASKNAPRNLVTGKQYRGINVYLLSMLGYSSPFFLTFKQVSEKGGFVRKGEQGHMVVYYGTAELEDRETGDPKVVPFLKYYKVFNVAQCEGLTVPVVDENVDDKIFSPIEQADAIFNAMPQAPDVRFGGNRAYYSPSLDYVQIPVKESFDTPDAYYNTLFHELAHSTGHTDRLARKGVIEASYFGSHEYSKEELVAEMTASFLSAEAGIESTFDNSVAYLQSWMRALKNDKTMLIRSASLAQKASDFILSRQAVAQTEPEKLAA